MLRQIFRIMNQYRNGSSRKNARLPSNIISSSMIKSSQPSYNAYSIKKQLKTYESKINTGLNSQMPLYTKSTIRQQNTNLYSYQKIQPSRQPYNLLEIDKHKDKNRFRIRQSRKQQAPQRANEQQQRLKEMEQSLKKRDKLRQQKEKEQLQKIKLMQIQKQSRIKAIDEDNKNKKSKITVKVIPKTLGLVGLNNIGNTCFMNSLLQCMLNIPDFNEYFLENQHKKEIKPNSRVALQYGHLVKLIRSSTNRSQTPSDIKSAIGAKRSRFLGYSQQDAQQFLAALLQLLSLDLNRSTHPKYRQLTADASKQSLLQISNDWWKYNKQRQDSIVCDFFTGQMLSKVVCSICKNQSIAFDNTWDYAINFSTDDKGEIIQMFKNFLRPEVISSDYYCSKCKGFKQCKRKLDFYRLPQVLVIQIKRFSYGRWRKVKLNNRVKVPQILDLGELITVSRHQSVKNPVYDLIGVVNHSGDIDFGHYTADCKNPYNQKWYHFNDSSVSQSYQKQILDSNSPYLLFYYKQNH